MVMGLEFGTGALILERIATILSYLLMFGGLIMLSDDWRVKRRTLVCILIATLVILMPVLKLGGFLVAVKQGYFTLFVAVLCLCHRTHNRVFWLTLFTIWSLVGMCSILSGLFSMPFNFRHRLFFKIPLVLFTLVFLWVYVRPVLRLMTQSPPKKLEHLSILPVGLLGFLVVSAQAMQEYEQNDPKFLLLLIGAMIIVFITVYGAFIYYFFILRREQQDEFDHDILRTQMLATSRRADELVQQDRSERGFIHDLRHNIRALSVCLDAGELEGARQLMDHLQRSLTGLETSRASIRQFTGHTVLDATITCYCNMAQEQNIGYEVSMRLPEQMDFDMVEFATVLANALENAINACKAVLTEGLPASIQVRAEDLDGKWMLQVTNPCPPDIRLDPVTKLPATKKEGHGYGTRSILNFAKKTGGLLDYHVNDGEIILRLVLFHP